MSLIGRTEVSDRIFSTSVDCSYDLVIPATALTVEGVSDLGIPFDKIYHSVVDTTLRIFSEDESASVQATLFVSHTVVGQLD